MDKKLLIPFTQLGYKIDYNDDVSKIKVFDYLGNELKSIVTEEGIVFYNDLHKLWINKDDSVKIKSKSGYVISINNVTNKKDKTNHEYKNICIEISRLETEINFGIDINRVSGLSHVTLNLYENILGKSHSVQRIRIKHERYGVNMSMNNEEPSGSMGESEYSSLVYLEAILYYLDQIFDFSYNTEVKEAIQLIIPILKISFDEIIKTWFDHIDEHINYCKDVRAGTDEDTKLLDEIIEYLERLKKNRKK